MTGRFVAAAAILAATVTACAPKVIEPPAGAPPRFPDFVFPAVPPGTGSPEVVSSLQRGWRLLQAGELRSAEEAFSSAVKASPAFYPAETGLGYVRLANRAYNEALAAFSGALHRSIEYVPALVGQGDALLGVARPREALDSFERALAVDPSLAEVRRRVEVVSLRLQQDALLAARRATAAGDYEAARLAYQQAIAGSPDSPFLYRDLAAVERLAGNPTAALSYLTKATALDPSDAAAWVQIGQLLEERKNFDGAVAAYARAAELEPGPASSERVERVKRRLALAKLPVEFQHISEAQSATRGDLAALIGIRLVSLVAQVPVREAAVITDLGGHWAADWIRPVASAGLMDVYPNHEFQPDVALRRSDLAIVASRVLQIIGRTQPRRFEEWRGGRPSIADVPAGNAAYPAAALVVTAGVMPLLAGGMFQPMHLVSGAEVLDVLGRLEVLSR